jgi:hypothetical protein
LSARVSEDSFKLKGMSLVMKALGKLMEFKLQIVEQGDPTSLSFLPIVESNIRKVEEAKLILTGEMIADKKVKTLQKQVDTLNGQVIYLDEKMNRMLVSIAEVKGWLSPEAQAQVNMGLTASKTGLTMKDGSLVREQLSVSAGEPAVKPKFSPPCKPPVPVKFNPAMLSMSSGSGESGSAAWLNQLMPRPDALNRRGQELEMLSPPPPKAPKVGAEVTPAVAVKPVVKPVVEAKPAVKPKPAIGLTTGLTATAGVTSAPTLGALGGGGLNISSSWPRLFNASGLGIN